MFGTWILILFFSLGWCGGFWAEALWLLHILMVHGFVFLSFLIVLRDGAIRHCMQPLCKWNFNRTLPFGGSWWYWCYFFYYYCCYCWRCFVCFEFFFFFSSFLPKAIIIIHIFNPHKEQEWSHSKCVCMFVSHTTQHPMQRQ